MAWLLLLGAIVSEVFGTTMMKLSDGFTRPLPAVGMVVGYIASFALLTLALKSFEVGTAYAIWSGLGTVLVVTIGVLALGESFSWAKAAGILLVIAGVALLNLQTAH